MLRELAVDLERVAVYDTDRTRASQFTTTAARLRALSDELDELRKDAARWRVAKAGLFITAGLKREQIEIVYQSGNLDELAEDMYPHLYTAPRGDGQVMDVTELFDAFIARSRVAPQRP